MITYDQQNEIENSSVIAGIDYNTVTKAMRVRFHSGSVKEYSGISETQYREFITAPSAGTYLNQKIKQTGITAKQMPGTNKKLNPWMK
jgi:hypothetical protein